MPLCWLGSLLPPWVGAPLNPCAFAFHLPGCHLPAVYEYAATKGISTDDMSWLFSTSKSKETKGLWKQVGSV